VHQAISHENGTTSLARGSKTDQAIGKVKQITDKVEQAVNKVRM